MNAAETIREYYETLRRGEPLYPYFAERPDVVKFGVGERLVGYDAVAEGLRDQTRTTDDWAVESQDLRVTERDGYAYFSDSVFMSWVDCAADHEYALSTRWSGTLERRAGDDEWLFVGMHVSTPSVDG
ncbi:MAG: nuclear transport factor 2 family protein [Haloplanus sp.]